MEKTKTHKVCTVDIYLTADTTFSFLVPNHLVDEGEVDEEITKEISNKFANGELDIDDLDEINVGNSTLVVGKDFYVENSNFIPRNIEWMEMEMNKYPIFGDDE